jgi:hypothetical protein
MKSREGKMNKKWNRKKKRTREIAKWKDRKRGKCQS